MTFTETMRKALRGDVRDDPKALAAYTGDGSNHRVVPRCVVFPADAEDVTKIINMCATEGVPITARGGGTSIAGNAVGPGVVVDFTPGMSRILKVDADAMTARVEPGVILDDLQARAQPYGMRFGPDPSTHSRCTLGGMIGNNACGSHSVAWGTTSDSVEELEIVTSSGEAMTLGAETGPGRLREIAADAMADLRTELGHFRRQVSGYGLHHLLPENGFQAAKAFTGSEGTLGVITSATVRLVRLPRVRALVVAGFAGEIDAAAAAYRFADLGGLTAEEMDAELLAAFDSRPGPKRRPELPEGSAWLLIEVGGETADEARERAKAVQDRAGELGGRGSLVVTDAGAQRAYWNIREKGAGLVTRLPDGREGWAGWEDAAVPPPRLAEYLGRFRELLRAHGRHGICYGHYGEGCIHVRIDHDLITPAGRRAYRAFMEEAADLVVSCGGTLSGEHGDGRARSELLPRMYGSRVIEAFEAVKDLFDPAGLLNPGVIARPRPMDADLRLSVSRPHRQVDFLYPHDDGDLGKAVRRCVGVGACRKESGGGMCPSYRATKDEVHSTRGRARVLFEMLDGSLRGPAGAGWRSEEALEALDLCLMCKACRAECPVTVDMATYKAEFLSQHYRGRIRPASHYSMGWLPLWLAAARKAPRLAARMLDLPGVERLARRIAGLDPNRSIPRPAGPSFRRWFKRRRKAGASAARNTTGAGATQNTASASSAGMPVMLWADTNTLSFNPEIARDAVMVLEAAGYQVTLSPPGLCCGITWVSTGQLRTARRVMRRTARALAASEMPVVSLEPSCGAALKTDLPELIGAEAAGRLPDRVMTLAEALEGRELPLREADGDVVAQFHCHQRATMGTDPDVALLRRAGYSTTSVDEGCCGLAGPFGFQKGHYDVSRTCAEQSFMPAVDAADESTPILADGLSCRLQIEEMAGREPIHLAQLLRRSLTP